MSAAQIMEAFDVIEEFDACTLLAELQAKVDHLADMAFQMMIAPYFGLGGTLDELRKIADDFAAADLDPVKSRHAATLESAMREAAEKLDGRRLILCGAA